MLYNYDLILHSVTEDSVVVYPLPSGRAIDNKIGKGGNGFVLLFIMSKNNMQLKRYILDIMYVCS